MGNIWLCIIFLCDKLIDLLIGLDIEAILILFNLFLFWKFIFFIGIFFEIFNGKWTFFMNAFLALLKTNDVWINLSENISVLFFLMFNALLKFFSSLLKLEKILIYFDLL